MAENEMFGNEIRISLAPRIMQKRITLTSWQERQQVEKSAHNQAPE
jgi:hypothetical protein